jgi:hypothetical protein
MPPPESRAKNSSLRHMVGMAQKHRAPDTTTSQVLSRSICDQIFRFQGAACSSDPSVPLWSWLFTVNSPERARALRPHHGIARVGRNDDAWPALQDQRGTARLNQRDKCLLQPISGIFAQVVWGIDRKFARGDPRARKSSSR